MQLYQACVVSKLMYGLQSIWLNKVYRCKLDGFHCRCLRKIAGIAHSYISRITNKEVLQTTGSAPLQNMLLRQQLQYYGGLLRNTRHPRHHLLHERVLDRRRGRPVLSWVKELNKHAAQFSDNVYSDCLNRNQWRKLVNEYCSKSNG